MDDQRLRLSVSVIVISALVALARVITHTNPVYDVIEPIVAPLEKLSSSLVSYSSSNVTGNDDAASKQRILELEDENSQLRNELALKNQTIQTTSAEVTRRDLTPYNQQVWLNVGAKDGVAEGNAVTAGGSLFGRVITVYDDSSVVELLTHPDSTTTIVVNSNLHGIQVIEYGSVIADLIPSESASGMLVQTDGLDGRYPAGIPIGILGAEITQTDNSYGQYAILLPYNPVDVRLVEVLTGGQ